MAKPKKKGRGTTARSASARKKTGRSVKRQSRPKPTRRAASRRTKPVVKGKAGGRKAVKPVKKPVRKPVRKAIAKKKALPVRKAAPRPTAAAPIRRKTAAPDPALDKRPRLDRQRRTLDETLRTPPSSLDMDRRGSAVRTGRAEMAEHLADHSTLTPDITAGDVDVNVEDAYFTGDESPGGDNSTPDQDVVDDIGKALGVEYDEGESLKGSDKVTERDKHRWELDPASAEDFKDRK